MLVLFASFLQSNLVYMWLGVLGEFFSECLIKTYPMLFLLVFQTYLHGLIISLFKIPHYSWLVQAHRVW